MSNKLTEIRESSEYKTLISTRSKIKWTLATLMLFVYYAFIMVIAFEPDLFGTKIGEGHTTIGIVIGLGIIFFSFLITGIYVYIANKVLEPLTKQLHGAAGDLK